jgi:hypothetical protein
MKISLTSDQLYASVVVFILGLGIMMFLPQFEKSDYSVKMGTVAVTAAPSETIQEFGTPAMINVPVTWSAPWVGSCYLTIDARPQGAEKGEPETPEWESNHLIRAKYDQKWWVQKWINVYLLQQRQGATELRLAITNPGTSSIDVYTELKCDDELLSQDQTTVAYRT